MNKNQFFAKFNNLNLRQEELERQWRVHLDEQAEMERRMQMHMRIFEEEQAEARQAPAVVVAAAGAASAAAGGGGGGGGGISPILSTDQTLLEFFKVDGSETWKYFTMNVSGTQSALLDSGIPSDWSIDWYFPPVQKKGYGVVFQTDGTTKFLMILNDGSILATITSTTGWSGRDADGNAVVFIYAVDGGYNLVFFNGDSYKQTFYPDATNIALDGNWDYSTFDKKVQATIYYASSRSYRLLSIDAEDVELYLHTDDNQIYANVSAYTYGEFVIVMLYDDNTGLWNRLRIFNTAGVLKQDVDLTFLPFNNNDLEFYGTNKAQIVFYTNNNSDPWQIYNYNGTSETFIAATQERGDNYNQISTISNNKYPYDTIEYDPEGMVNIFFSYTTYDGFLRTGYTKATFLFDGNTVYGTYTLTDSGTPDIGFQPWSIQSTAYSSGLVVDFVDGFLSAVLFQPNGSINIVHLTTASDMNNISNYDIFYCGNRIGFNYPRTSNVKRYKLYSPTGSSVLTTFDTDTLDVYYNNQYDSMFIRQYTDGQNRVWYFNNSVTVFTEILTDFSEAFDDYTTFYEKPDNKDDGVFLFYNSVSKKVIVLTKESISGEIILPENGQIILGKTYFAHIYTDINSKVIINLYDFNGTIVNTVLTDSTDSLNDYFATEDRFVFQLQSAGIYTTYLVTPTIVEMSIVTNVSQQARMVNDYAFWDD